MKNKKAKQSEEPKAAAPAYQNRVTLVGYLGNQPETYADRATFSVATKASWKPADSADWVERTEWHRCVAWGKLVPAMTVLAKGDHVLIEGELRSNEYERELPVVGGGTTIVPTKTWEIRVRAVRKLVRKPKQEKAA